MAATSYFWRVDEIAGAYTNTGSVWSFSTGPAPALLHQYSFSETGGGNTADAIGGPAWTGTLPGGGALSGGQLTLASATSQYASLPAGIVSSLNNFTIMAWVNLASTANWVRLFDFGNNTTVYMFLAPQNGSTGKVRYAITTGSTGGEQQINCNSTLSTGAWHQLAVTLNGATGILYIDGVPVGTNSAMTLTPSSLGGTANNYIGKSQWSDPTLNGQIDEFRIYSVALPAAQIAATYALGPNAVFSTNSPVVSLQTFAHKPDRVLASGERGLRIAIDHEPCVRDLGDRDSPAPQIVNTNYLFTLPATNAMQFFRLSK